MRLGLLFCALVLATGGAPLRAEAMGPAVPPKIPIANFAALPTLFKPLLSPDGHRIAARRAADGATTIILLNADRPDTVAKAIPVGKTRVAGLKWAGNQRLLLTVQSTYKINGFDFPFRRLIAIDVETGASRVVDRRSRGMYAGDVLYTDPTGSWALVAGQDDTQSYPSVKRVDLATGDATVVEKSKINVWDWYADEKGVVRAGIAYDGSRWTIWYRDKPEEKLRAIRGKFPKDDDSTVDRFIFRGDNSWVVTNERTGRFGLYKYDLKTQTMGQPIFENPDVDLDDVFYNSITGEVSAVEYRDDRSRVFWLEPDMKALQTRIDKALPDSVNITVGWSGDEKKTLVWSASAADPGRYFLLDRATSQMHAVVEPYPDIDPDQLAPVKPVRFQARDGLGLRGYLTLPRGREAKGLPLIVLPHGGPFARDDWEYDPFVQFLANRGYAVLQPEFRGSTGFGKDFVSKGHGEIGKKMQDDLDDSVDWLAKSGQVDPKRVCILGLSYGGYAAMWGAIRNPERYRCAISWAGPSDLPAMMRYDRKQFSATRYFREWRKKFSSNDDLNAVSPINFADRFKVPLLIGHGEEDETVPPKQTHKMVEALQKAGANVTPVFYKDSEHSFGSSKDLADWLAHLEAFLAKYNPA
ncbi:MAG TPA: alpha/beta fold hydrolase [Sphingomicrobium sp.]|nr:alpha/beta fold hydrolase [Sphingomicrobium sp.]